jgi:hypothetical protein
MKQEQAHEPKKNVYGLFLHHNHVKKNDGTVESIIIMFPRRVCI